jgi:hypothetical protein
LAQARRMLRRASGIYGLSVFYFIWLGLVGYGDFILLLRKSEVIHLIDIKNK